MTTAASPSTARHHHRHATVRSAFTLNDGNLGGRVVSGASFTFLGIALRTVLTIGSMSILARLLTPADFGYIAMAAVVTEFAGLLNSFGFANILIQRRTVARLHLDTVFWASLCIGAVITLLVFALSFASGWLFSEEMTGELLRVLCFTFLCGSFTTVHEAILSRLMRFRTEFWIQISVIVIRSAVAIICATFGMGVWSLVAGAMTGAIIGPLIMLAVIPYLPRFRFNKRYLLSSWRTSGSYMGNTIIYYVSMNTDIFMIGRQLGAQALGFYQNARSLSDEVRGRIAMPLQRVLFPALSAIQDDPARLRHSVRRCARLLAAIICPVGFGLGAIAPDLVPALYGEQWLPMVPVLSMLGISAALRGSTAIASSLFNSQNRVGLAFRLNLAGVVLLVVSVLASLPYGLTVVAAAISANALFSVLMLRVAFGLIGLDGSDVLDVLLRPLLAACGMWAAIALQQQALASSPLHVSLKLLLDVATGALVYSLLLHLLSRQYLQEFQDLGRKLLKTQ